MRAALLLLLFPLIAFAQEYPETKKTTQEANRHGISYSDDYTWLEDMRGTEVNEWVDLQNKIYSTHINSLSATVYPLPAITKYANQTNYKIPTKKRAYYYSLGTYRDRDMETATLGYRKTINGKFIELVNPNFFYNNKTVNVIDYEPSVNSQELAYKLMIDGSDRHQIRFVNINRGKKYNDVIPNAKYGGIVWKGDEGVFYAKNMNTSQFAVDSTYQIYYHKLGSDVKQDIKVFEAASECQFDYFTSHDGAMLFIAVTDKTETKLDFYYADLTKESFELIKFVNNVSANFNVIGYYNGVAYMKGNTNWGSIESFALDNPNIKKVIIPQYQGQLLTGTWFFKDRILCRYKNTEGSYLMLFDSSGKFIRKIQTPAGTEISVTGNDFSDIEVLFYLSSYTIPPILFNLNLQDGAYDRFINKDYAKTTAPFPLDYFVSTTTTYTTRDSVQVPITIVHKKGLKMDGNSPTLLEAYGGFGTVSSAHYDVGLLYFLNNGGVYAYAGVRGGGDKGEMWHRAGAGLNKINTVNDFIDAAQYMIKMNYTSANRLGITGGSQGGLLVGAAMVLRPDLFKVAIPEVGVYDMANFHEYTVARFHRDEYGNPDDAKEFAAMMQYSPYHNIKDNVNYPTTLIITSDNDDRVPPVHSYKFAARLQNRPAQINPVYLKTRRDSGHHGVTSNRSESLHESSEFFSFLLYHLNR